ncbi:MAG: TolB family protein [Gaiellaceae bacterium]
MPFQAGFGTQARTLISETWDRGQLLGALFPTTGAPKLNSLNAHFDHQRLLPAAENAAQREVNLVTVADIPANAMAGRLGFSIGCHSGLAVSDAIFGAANLLSSDWAQAMLGTGAVGWIGNTGYGLGDTVEVAYSERLHALLSRKLDGSLTLGQAIAQAKQDYIATLATIGPYDVKVVEQTTLYGLPMLRLGAGIPPTPPPPLPTHTDPATGLQAASFSATPTFTRVSSPYGAFDRADNGTQASARRPLLPLHSFDIRQPGSAVAHGVLLRSVDTPATPPWKETNFNIAFSSVQSDDSTDSLELVGQTASPSRRQSIATFTGPSGELRQRANLIVGTFRSDSVIDSLGIGDYQRDRQVTGDVFYSTSSDWRPPELRELETITVGTGVGFSTEVTDRDQSGGPGSVKIVLVLYRDCAGVTRTAYLQPSGGSRYSGGGPVAAGCTEVEYDLEAVDAAGNVAVSRKKVLVQPVIVPPDVVPPNAAPITSAESGTVHASGWYRSGVTVTLTSTDPIVYSLDNQAFQPYSGPFAVTGDGIHSVDAQTTDGAQHSLAFGIDTTAPAIVINTPTNGAVYALGQQVRADYACTDAGSGTTSCTGTVANGAFINTSSLGNKTFTVNATSDVVGNTASANPVSYSVAYRKVLFASTRDGNSEIYSMTLPPSGVGTNVTRLTTHNAIDAAPEWSPDGRRIIFTSTRTGNGDIYAMNPDGTGVVQLTTGTAIEALGAYSPDGSKIVFTSTKAGNVEIYVMNADGTGQARLTTHSAVDADPVFSPSGTQIAWSSNRVSSSNYDIYTATISPTNVLGTATKLTTATAFDGEPAWSSANRIAFTSTRDGNAEIYTMPEAGGPQTRRTNNSGTDTTSAWSADETQLVFSSNRSGSAGYDVYSMTVPASGLGTSVTRRTMNAAWDGTPSW